MKTARTWEARHWAVILAAPMLVITGGVFAYAKLTEHAPIVRVPNVVDTDVFAAAGILKDAGFEVDSKEKTSARPGGTILAQHPANGEKLEQGSTVMLTVSSTHAIVPYVAYLTLDDATARLAGVGLLNPTVTPDYRDDVDPGTVMSSNPGTSLRVRKSEPIELVVAFDPHVDVPNVVGLDQATATAQLQELGLEVAVQNASSRSQAPGQVLKTSPGDGTTLTRGDTVTLTVSTGPRQVNVPAVVGWDVDDAVSELEDRGFAVAVGTVSVTSSDEDDTVLAQSPTGGQASEGSTVALTVGVRSKKG